MGTGKGQGAKKIVQLPMCSWPKTPCWKMDTVQLGGVDNSLRTTTGVLGPRSRLVVRERIMTDHAERALTQFQVELKGEDCGVDLISRSVAKGDSYQEFRSCLKGLNRCSGHSECDAILVGNGKVHAAPALEASHVDAALIHEAAIGKIAGEQILKLRTLGLTEEEAEERIIAGFLK